MERGVLQWPIALAGGLLRPLHPPRLVQAPYLKEQFRVCVVLKAFFRSRYLGFGRSFGPGLGILGSWA